jgi:hypothetical protein
MPAQDAERNMRLFAAEVMPALKKVDVSGPLPAAVPAAAGPEPDMKALGF